MKILRFEERVTQSPEGLAAMRHIISETSREGSLIAVVGRSSGLSASAFADAAWVDAHEVSSDTAIDLPREDKPDMPPAGEIKVYVTVVAGEAPVFTRVVR